MEERLSRGAVVPDNGLNLIVEVALQQLEGARAAPDVRRPPGETGAAVGAGEGLPSTARRIEIDTVFET